MPLQTSSYHILGWDGNLFFAFAISSSHSTSKMSWRFHGMFPRTSRSLFCKLIRSKLENEARNHGASGTDSICSEMDIRWMFFLALCSIMFPVFEKRHGEKFHIQWTANASHYTDSRQKGGWKRFISGSLWRITSWQIALMNSSNLLFSYSIREIRIPWCAHQCN